MLRYLAKNEDAYLQWESVLDMLSMFVDALPLMDEEDNLSKPSGAHLAGQGAGRGKMGSSGAWLRRVGRGSKSVKEHG